MFNEIIWLTAAGFPSYEVSSNGEVRHAKKKNIKKQRLDRAARLVVTLAKGSYVTPVMVHRMVAEAFIGPLPDGMETCHNDGNALNNSIANLRYDTKSGNEADKKRHGTDNACERNGRSKITLAQALEIRMDSRSSAVVGRAYGIHKTTVRAIRKLKTWVSA